MPDLVPEETSKEWLSSKRIQSAGKSLKQNIGFHFQDYLTDPRIGSTLLMCGCISFGIIWLRNNKATQNTQQVNAFLYNKLNEHSIAFFMDSNNFRVFPMLSFLIIDLSVIGRL